MPHSNTAYHPLKVLGVYAHPDDESFCAGGTLAKLAARGAETMVVSFTQGEAGQIHDQAAASRQTLGSTRARELALACGRLGVQHFRCLNFGDGHLAEVEFMRLVCAVTQIIREFKPDIVLTFGADGAYGHPDHITIGAATDDAFLLAGRADHCAKQLEMGLAPHQPAQLYHSYFPRQNYLLLDYLASWLQSRKDRKERFKGGSDYLRGVTAFSNSLKMLGFANDHVDIEWYSPGFHVVEQGEAANSLYLILSGYADVVQEDVGGQLAKVDELGAGQYFGETGIATEQPRNAHVIAREGLSCLVFAAQEPANFAGRGAAARLTASQDKAVATLVSQAVCVDTAAFAMNKVAAIGAHRTQCPITAEMFPKQIWRKLFGREYFVCRYNHKPQLAIL